MEGTSCKDRCRNWSTPIGARSIDIAPLVELGRRLEALGRVRTHSSDAYAGTAFNHAPMLYPNGKSTAETLADVAHAKAWTSLLNVQTDDLYRTLVDEVLDDIKPQVDRADAEVMEAHAANAGFQLSLIHI